MEFPEPIPYQEAYPKGSSVRIADREFLENFRSAWTYHDNLGPEQLEFAGRVAVVEGVGYYHGGDPIYKLTGIPGLWLERCLRKG